MLYRYAFLVKNLRGVIAAMDDDRLSDWASWLSKRFRYRDLGVPGCLLEKHREVFEGRLGGNPFHRLEYPTSRVDAVAKEMARRLAGITGLDECVAHSLLLASAYASPVIALPRAAEGLASSIIAVHVVRGSRMGAREARLHLRIVDYTVLDAYVESVEEARRAIGSRDATGLRARRVERARRDEKRYWRVMGKGDTLVIIYLDHVSPLIESGYAPPTGPEESVLLAQLAAFNLGSVEA